MENGYILAPVDTACIVHGIVSGCVRLCWAGVSLDVIFDDEVEIDQPPTSCPILPTSLPFLAFGFMSTPLFPY